MAVILGQKIVKDTATYNDYAFGITLPITIGKNAFNQSFTSYDQVKTNIKSLLLTKRGERVMQPNLGSGLHEIVFDNNDDLLATKIQTTIESAINFWLPYVNIELIDVIQGNQNKNQNRVEIRITFRIGNNIKNDTVTLNL